MVYGYSGTVLRIDLSKNEIKKESLNMDLAYKHIGGKGLGAKILYDELKQGIDPLSPENILIFTGGPLIGTYTPGGCKYAVVTKSPLTNTFLDTNASGFFGPELKHAGYDIAIFYGRSEKPVYVWISDDEVKLENAEHLWGKNSHETEKIIKKDRHDEKVRVASIGQAGERLVRYACITNDLYRHAGRGGAGAVMGSKRLKAIAARGSKGVQLADFDAFKTAAEEAYRICDEAPHEWANTTGTTTGMTMYTDAGVFPTNNMRTGIFEGIDKIKGESIRAKFNVTNKACFSCPYRCWQIMKVDEGPYSGTILAGPEYETVSLLGGNCGIDTPDAIIKANLICDELGIDTMSAGGVVSFAMECYENGIIDSKDTGGIDLRFGNAAALISILPMIANREGIGDVLAEGVVRASRKLGKDSEKYAIHVKGMTLAGYEPRGLFGMALAYATSDRGGCHLRACPADAEIASGAARFSTEGKGKLVKDMQDEKAAKDSLGVCILLPLGLEHYAKLLSAATGRRYTKDDLLKAGERAYNLTRLFNLREGFTRKDDTLPERLVKEPMPEGSSKGCRIAREILDKMLDEYYAVRGWDSNGVPNKTKLKELELDGN